MYKNLKNRLQVVLTVVLFLPVLLDALGKLTNHNDLILGKTTLQYSLISAIVLAIYVLIEIIGKKIWNWLLKTINILLLLEVFLAAMVFGFMSISTSPDIQNLPIEFLYIYRTVLMLFIATPSFIFGCMFINLLAVLFTSKSKDRKIITKKILPEWFEMIRIGKKKYELRLADFDMKDMKDGDILRLEEWAGEGEHRKPTGRVIEKKITYVRKIDLDAWLKSQPEIEKEGFYVLQFE